MAKTNPELILAIRRTAEKLSKGAPYQWGHMGSCNCGNLAQELTRLSKREIHSYAMQKSGDWTEQLNDYCPESKLPMDQMVSEMLNYGLDREDLMHLERLSDPVILRHLPVSERNLKHNFKNDVVKYLKTWANLLEMQLLQQIDLENLETDKKSIALHE